MERDTKELIQGVCINQNGELLLCLHIRSTGEKEWTLVGGKHDTYFATLTMLQEFKQELTWNINVGEVLITFHHEDGRGKVTSTLYNVHMVIGEMTQLKTDEISAIKWIQRISVEEALREKAKEETRVFLDGYPISYLTHRILRWLHREYNHPEWI